MLNRKPVLFRIVQSVPFERRMRLEKVGERGGSAVERFVNDLSVGQVDRRSFGQTFVIRLRQSRLDRLRNHRDFNSEMSFL